MTGWWKTTASLALLLCGCMGHAIPVRVHEDEPVCVVEAVDAAVHWWNLELGMSAFRLAVVADGRKPVGAVTVYSVLGPLGLDGEAWGHTSAHLARRVVRLRMMAADECHPGVHRIAAHELGHALRLRHHGAGEDDLMLPGGEGWATTKAQRRRARRAARLWFGKLWR